MNVAKFGSGILIIGIVILAIGVIQFGINQPKTFDRSESRISSLGGRDDFSNWIETKEINAERGQKRKQSTNIMIVGGIIVLLGGIIKVSGNQASTTVSGLNSETHKLNQNDYRYCTMCGKKHSSTSTGQFCDECGNKL